MHKYMLISCMYIYMCIIFHLCSHAHRYYMYLEGDYEKKNPRRDSSFQGFPSISFQERNSFNYTEMCDPQRVHPWKVLIVQLAPFSHPEKQIFSILQKFFSSDIIQTKGRVGFIFHENPSKRIAENRLFSENRYQKKQREGWGQVIWGKEFCKIN